MNVLTLHELQEQGFAALEQALESGPVHIVKQNQPIWVVMREDEYVALQKKCVSPKSTRILELFAQAGDRERDELDQRWRTERAAWNKS